MIIAVQKVLLVCYNLQEMPFNKLLLSIGDQARFRLRGLDSEYGTTMINGITMNKIYDGRPQYSNWGGLNDATRNQEFTSWFRTF